MKRILITGAGGQLGIALNHLFNELHEYEIYNTYGIAEEQETIRVLDITDEADVTNCVLEIKPDVIINCAALTAVDLCESEQDKAYCVNALGPKNLARAADYIGAKLIHISTDYVFDGMASAPYTEEHKPNQISIYGKTKQAGDEFVQEYCTKFFILRTAWVYGEGKNFVKTMLRLAENNHKIRVVADQYGTPTSALELARVILFLMETESYGIYHATCEGSTTWYEFAKTIFAKTGQRVEVEAITTSEYPTPAKRPMYSILDNKALRERHGYYMKNWEEAFVEFIKYNATIL
jgi:dTDP-4-dehydrorhamnose reductase